jgi:hypothetical protein
MEGKHRGNREPGVAPETVQNVAASRGPSGASGERSDDSAAEMGSQQDQAGASSAALLHETEGATENSKVPGPVTGFGKRSTKIWTVAAGVVTVMTMLIAAAQLVISTDKVEVIPSEGKLELVGLAVQRPSEVDGDVYDMASDSRTPASTLSVDTVVVDITLKNVGSSPVVILATELRFLFARQMENCAPVGGTAGISAQYSIRVPSPPPPVPFTEDRPMLFEVKGGVTDRFTISVGPEDQYISAPVPWLYVFDLSINTDDSAKSIFLGTAALVARSGDGIANASNAQHGRRECVENNFRVIQDLFKLRAVRAVELNEVRNRYAEMAGKPDD